MREALMDWMQCTKGPVRILTVK